MRKRVGYCVVRVFTKGYKHYAVIEWGHKSRSLLMTGKYGYRRSLMDFVNKVCSSMGLLIREVVDDSSQITE